jgi:hypothetical protein
MLEDRRLQALPAPLPGGAAAVRRGTANPLGVPPEKFGRLTREQVDEVFEGYRKAYLVASPEARSGILSRALAAAYLYRIATSDISSGGDSRGFDRILEWTGASSPDREAVAMAQYRAQAIWDIGAARQVRHLNEAGIDLGSDLYRLQVALETDPANARVHIKDAVSHYPNSQPQGADYLANLALLVLSEHKGYEAEFRAVLLEAREGREQLQRAWDSAFNKAPISERLKMLAPEIPWLLLASMVGGGGSGPRRPVVGSSRWPSKPFTLRFEIEGHTGAVTYVPPDKGKLLQRYYYLFTPGQEFDREGMPTAKLGQPLAWAALTLHSSNERWEFIAGSRLGAKDGQRRFVSAIERHVGTEVHPSAVLSQEDYLFWNELRPDAVQYYSRILSGNYVNPRWLSQRIDQIDAQLRRPGDWSSDELILLRSSRAENGRLWDKLPAEAKTREALEQMF